MLPAYLNMATHGCPHHLDELVAIALFERLFRHQHPYGSFSVTFLHRDEVEDNIGNYEFAIDIGGRYDPERGRFDHHNIKDVPKGKSSAGLVFDYYYHHDPRYNYLKPIIDCVDRIDNGLITTTEIHPLVTVTSLLKAVGGMDYNVDKSWECYKLIRQLVDSWFKCADDFLEAKNVVNSATVCGMGILLKSNKHYGPGLLEYVRDNTGHKFVGFPAEPGRFIVRAVEDLNRNKRITFNRNMFSNADFVHKAGFMAVFKDYDSAYKELSSLI